MHEEFSRQRKKVNPAHAFQTPHLSRDEILGNFYSMRGERGQFR
jgi:hypothetical protein